MILFLYLQHTRSCFLLIKYFLEIARTPIFRYNRLLNLNYTHKIMITQNTLYQKYLSRKNIWNLLTIVDNLAIIYTKNWSCEICVTLNEKVLIYNEKIFIYLMCQLCIRQSRQGAICNIPVFNHSFNECSRNYHQICGILFEIGTLLEHKYFIDFI